MLPLLEIFLELLLWNSFQCHRNIFFLDVLYSEIFVPLRQTLFLETDRSHAEPNKGKRLSVPFQQSVLGPKWNEFKVNITLNIEEVDEHCLHL